MKIAVSRSRTAFLILALIVVATTVVLVVNRNTTTEHLQSLSRRQTLQLDIPDSPWEPAFFTALEERTRAVGLSSLRTVLLPENDLEVRFWHDRLEIVSGVVIRRTGQEWSASWIYQVEDSRPSSARLVALDQPKSGWEVFWKNLVEGGILTLPDSPRPQCPTEALDGISYVVETNVDGKYRTYMYSNPQLMKCAEAKQLLQLDEMIRQEFSLGENRRLDLAHKPGAIN
jgi:hypothetical protein